MIYTEIRRDKVLVTALTAMTGLLIHSAGVTAQTPPKPSPKSPPQAPDPQSEFWQHPDQIAPVTHHRVIHRGEVVLVRPGEIVFGLGQNTGIRAGDRIRIKREFHYTHPASGEKGSEWLPIGVVRVAHVDQTMSKAALDPAELIAAVVVGDIVECVVVSAAPAQNTAPKGTLPDEPTSAWLKAWQENAGKSLKARIGVWEEFLRSQPESPHAALAAKYLRELRTLEARLAPPSGMPKPTRIDGLEHDRLRSSDPHQPIDLAFYVPKPEALAGAWLHYRRSGARSYRKAPLQRENDVYLRGRIPADMVDASGIDYFVEVATHDGKVGAAVGTPDEPVAVAVESPPISRLFTTPQNRSRVSLTASYLDFNNIFEGRHNITDRFILYEADFLYRIRGAIYSVRTGFGAFNGERTSEVTGGEEDTSRSLNYGYTELELRSSKNIALSGRLIVGIASNGDESDVGMGGEGRLRLGSEENTNFSIGFSQIENIGYIADMRMQWNAMARAPLGLSVAVTDQPDGEDTAVRLTTDLGYRFRPWIQPTLRLSYQARSVEHAGIGAGLGLVLDW